jgi:hypothetical protein
MLSVSKHDAGGRGTLHQAQGWCAHVGKGDTGTWARMTHGLARVTCVLRQDCPRGRDYTDAWRSFGRTKGKIAQNCFES